MEYKSELNASQCSKILSFAFCTIPSIFSKEVGVEMRGTQNRITGPPPVTMLVERQMLFWFHRFVERLACFVTLIKRGFDILDDCSVFSTLTIKLICISSVPFFPFSLEPSVSNVNVGVAVHCFCVADFLSYSFVQIAALIKFRNCRLETSDEVWRLLVCMALSLSL